MGVQTFWKKKFLLYLQWILIRSNFHETKIIVKYFIVMETCDSRFTDASIRVQETPDWT